ncbi:hypothetical protein [Micromonospora sp. NPDC047074]|uniref:hypothetical protein n=1 Tax=Micromonospora sp. NPDC047074 TaxID=3154339 RepID=UPI0033E8A2E1
MDAAKEARNKALDTGADGIDAVRRLGNEALDRARSATGRVSSQISERTLRRREGDKEA